MQDHHGALGPNAAHGVLEAHALAHRLGHELLHGGLAEGAEHASAEAARETLHTDEADAFDFRGLTVENAHPCVAQDVGDLLVTSALVIVVAENADDGDRAGL